MHNFPQNQGWNPERVFIDGDKYFEDLLAGIHGAKSKVLFETYIFEKGVLGDRVFDAFCSVAKRGVEVCILVDGYGSPNFSAAYEDELSNQNIHVRFYRTLPWDPRAREDESPSFFKRLRSRFYRLNHGTHRKYCLVDGRRLWSGSYNVSDEHLASVKGDEAWRDLGIYVEGPDVAWVEKAFSQSFARKRSLKEFKHFHSKWLLLNQTRKLKKAYRSVQMEKLKTAHRKVVIETPYFVPLNSVFRRLIKLVRRGVEVHIVVPKRNDVWLAKWISYSYLFQLARKGVKIHEYQPRFMHNKVFLIDDWICLGSTNLNHRSFLHDLEMDVVVSQPQNQRLLTDLLHEDFKNSIPLNRDIWTAFPWWKRLVSRILSIFSYWA